LAAKNRYFDAVEQSQDLLDKLIERYERDGFLSLASIEVDRLAKASADT
jgi:hypothetical protein